MIEKLSLWFVIVVWNLRGCLYSNLSLYKPWVIYLNNIDYLKKNK